MLICFTVLEKSSFKVTHKWEVLKYSIEWRSRCAVQIKLQTYKICYTFNVLFFSTVAIIRPDFLNLQKLKAYK